VSECENVVSVCAIGKMCQWVDENGLLESVRDFE